MSANYTLKFRIGGSEGALHAVETDFYCPARSLAKGLTATGIPVAVLDSQGRRIAALSTDQGCDWTNYPATSHPYPPTPSCGNEAKVSVKYWDLMNEKSQARTLCRAHAGMALKDLMQALDVIEGLRVEAL